MSHISEPPKERRTVNVQQAADMIGVTKRTIWQYLADKKLTRLETPGNNPRVYVDELLRVKDESVAE